MPVQPLHIEPLYEKGFKSLALRIVRLKGIANTGIRHPF